jgi:CRISPR-associated protein Csm4
MKPKSSFHLGEKGIGIEKVTPYAHSDTIFSALCLSYLYIFGQDELEELLKQFINRQPPFLISSIFPLYNDGESKILFFPKPLIIPKTEEHKENGWKKLKEASFFSKEVFEKCLINGIDCVLEDLTNNTISSINGIILTQDEKAKLKDSKIKLYDDHQAPRNTINRLKSSSEIYYMGLTTYPSNSDMYFLIEAIKDMSNKLDKVLSLLEEEGIGGERSLGYGRFRFIKENIEVTEADNTDAFITLSLYHPTKEEVQNFTQKTQFLSYKLLTRVSYAFSPTIKGGKLKQRVRMMQEGSIFPKIENRNLYGDISKVLDERKTDSHAVYRYGFAFPLRIKV